jgi:hypothetical protein
MMPTLANPVPTPEPFGVSVGSAPTRLIALPSVSAALDPTYEQADVGRLKPRSGGADIEVHGRFEMEIHWGMRSWEGARIESHPSRRRLGATHLDRLLSANGLLRQSERKHPSNFKSIR